MMPINCIIYGPLTIFISCIIYGPLKISIFVLYLRDFDGVHVLYCLKVLNDIYLYKEIKNIFTFDPLTMLVGQKSFYLINLE